MGLAQPKKRTKISHDPRNLSWTNQGVSSYGQRLMQAQGWQEGQSLGARSSASDDTGARSQMNDATRLAAAKVGVLFKDDNLGIGAKGDSREIIEAQRTGLDAFQGLLGRLNGKVTEEELQKQEKKDDDRKLAMYAAGRWGGMIFVPGGVLVQGEEFKSVREAKKAVEEESVNDTETIKDERIVVSDGTGSGRIQRRLEKDERKRLRAERRQRKEAKRVKRLNRDKRPHSSEREDVELKNDAVTAAEKDTKCTTANAIPPDEDVSSSDGEKPSTVVKATNSSRTESRSRTSTPAGSGTSTPLRNGRHLLRSRNIQAKRMAFSNVKVLDEIFMRNG